MLDDRYVPPLWHEPVSTGRLSYLAHRVGAPAALAVLVALALVLRQRSLESAGILDIDEARLTLAAQGVATHGWPVFPSGKLYTRGLLQSFLMAPSVALLAPLELAARLPSMVAGAALVLVVYLYGRRLAGSGAGLFAAALVATSVPLIAQSREAWFYAIFTLCWMVALLLLDRAVASGSFRALLAGATAVGLTFLTHEFALTLLPGFGLALLWWRAESQPLPARLRPLLFAALPAGLGLAVLTACSLTLRADTAGGTMSEISGLLRFRRNLDGPTMYAAAFLPGWTAWLLGPGILSAGLLAPRPLRRRLLLAVLPAAALFVLTSFFLSQRQPRYGLPLLPTGYLLAGVGLAQLGQALRQVRHGHWAAASLVPLAFVILVTLSVPSGLFTSPARRRPQMTWPERLYEAGYTPGDLVLTNNPTVTYLYVGRTDFWLRSSGYDKYVREDGGQLRDIHTNAVLLSRKQQLRELLLVPYQGRTAWVIAWRSPDHWQEGLEPELLAALEGGATQHLDAGSWTVYRLPS
jgi:4-amino-4-deoxy-L-arabinose transferase-like glycosyltransferase